MAAGTGGPATAGRTAHAKDLATGGKHDGRCDAVHG